MKQVKILFFIVLSLLCLALVSCMSGGGQPAQGWSGVVIDSKGILYIGSMDGKIVAVDPSTRNVEWSYTFPQHSSGSGGISCGQVSTPVPIYSTPAVDDSLVYIGVYSGKAYAFNATTGAVRWVYPKEGDVGSIVGDPRIVGDTIYMCSSDSEESDGKEYSRVYALETTYGEFKWESEPLGERLWETPAIEGETIYISTCDGHIYILSTQDGHLMPWVFTSDIGFISSPMLYEGNVFVGAFDSNLCAVKIGSGEVLWKFRGGNWFWATPVATDGVVYAGCLDGKIYAIDANWGTQLWEFDTGSPIVSSPILVDDVLVVAAEAGDVYVFDIDAKPVSETMMPVKSISIDALIRGSFCAREGIVYIRAQNNCLYALDITEGRVNWKLPLTIE